MTTQRFALNQHGGTRFDVVDQVAQGPRRIREVIAGKGADAHSYTAYLNECETRGIAPLVFEDWWMEQPLPGTDEEESE